MPPQDTPPAELDIDVALVRRLLTEQHPDLADRPLTLLASGWDNVLYRIGDDLVARLPRRQAGAALVASEQRWLPVLAPRLPLPVPLPVRAGTPSAHYPWAWSVCRYVAGSSALAALAGDAPFDPTAAADRLGRFCAALHQPADADAPRNAFRGVPLATRDLLTRRRIDELADLVDAPAAHAVWRRALAVPAHPGPPVWLHGDLHPGNLVVGADGQLAAVIDFGDVTAGDPATDLAVAWMLFTPDDRWVFRSAAATGGVDGDTWSRARGWALSLGVAILANSADNPPYRELARRTIEAVLADQG